MKNEAIEYQWQNRKYFQLYKIVHNPSFEKARTLHFDITSLNRGRNIFLASIRVLTNTLEASNLQNNLSMALS